MFIASINRDATCQNRQIDAYVQGRYRFTGNLFSLITFCCLHEGVWGLVYPLSMQKSNLWPQGYKTFFMFNSTEHEISTACLKIIYRQMKKFIADTSLTADPGVASSIPARSHTLVDIDHEIISTVILLPSAESFKRVVVSYKRKYVLVNCLLKLAQKKWLDELTILP